MSASPALGMSSMSTAASHRSVELCWTSDQLNVRDLNEDWKGVTDPTERRKLQNRLNQRARRLRARDTRQSTLFSSSKTDLGAQPSTARESSDHPASSDDRPASPKSLSQWKCFNSSPRVRALMKQFAEHARLSYMRQTPAIEHLPLLIQYNVNSALSHNAKLLGICVEYYDWDGISPFTKQGPMLGLTSQGRVEWPVSLQPTELQTSVDHHPWIDLFPWPRLRDNMLQAFESLKVGDEDELCHDVSDYDGAPSLIIWGSPWDPRGWEVSTKFLQKWAWLLSGCVDLLGATNYWRAKRGERLITRKDFENAVHWSLPAQLRQSEIRIGCQPNASAATPGP